MAARFREGGNAALMAKAGFPLFAGMSGVCVSRSGGGRRRSVERVHPVRRQAVYGIEFLQPAARAVVAERGLLAPAEAEVARRVAEHDPLDLAFGVADQRQEFH